jgi:polysaccharide chain length determinant protein (PEP-CTERM system associated)
MENQQRQQVKKYLDLLISHWKLLAGCLLIALTVGLVLYLRMPKVYQCTSLLSYERQQINPARMAPEQDNQRLRDTISTLSDVVTSRNNLEGIIQQFDLYPEARQRLPIEDVIDGMRKHIKVTPSPRGDTFTVLFEGGDQEKVMKVTNALASKFIEENLKYREARATETSKYTQDELNLAKTVLDKKEQVMRDYKLKHYNEMPEQRESNLARLNSLHEQYQGIQDSIQDLERTRVMAREQINLRKRLAGAIGAIGGSGGAATTTAARVGHQPMTPFQRLQQLYSHLETLKGRYTDKHPEIRRTKQQIAKLEADLAGKKPSTGKRTTATRRVQDPEIAQLQLQMKEIGINIEKLRSDQKTIRASIEQYEKWVSAAPIREAEWNALTRDYDELRRHYDYLVAQNLQASSVEHLERKQKGSKFKIVDSARFPDKPFKPDFFKIILAAVAGALAVGVGLVFAMDFIDTSFKDVSEVEEYLGIPVVSSIPYLQRKDEAGRNRVRTIAWAVGFLLYSGLLLAALVYFWLQGRIII